MKKSAHTIKLLISDSQSDIDSDITINHNSLQTNRQLIQKQYVRGKDECIKQSNDQQYQQNQEEINNLIDKVVIKFKNGNQVQQQDKEGKDIEKYQTLESRTQTLNGTQSIAFVNKQVNIQGMRQNKMNFFDQLKYNFNVQDKKDAIKKLKTQSLEIDFKPIQSKQKIIQKHLIDTQKAFKIEGIPVYFPYQPYAIQKDYMEAVIKALNHSQNALLESPTGTGKTLCLLSSILSWADHYNNSQHQQKLTIIYCSRTHAQLKQVQSQLQKTCFRPTMCNFGSRDQFCIKGQFKQIKGRDLMESCSKAVKLYLRAKRKLELDEQHEPEPEPNQESISKQKFRHICSHFKTEPEYSHILQSRYLNKIITSDMIKQQGKRYGFCPYYYAFHIKQRADLIFMPYNYILDVSQLPRYETILKNSIVIFDQAHNVPQAACQGRSYSIFSTSFQRIDAELNKLEYHPYMSQQLRQVSYSFNDTIGILKKSTTYFKQQLNKFAQQIYSRQSLTRHSAYMYNTESQFDIQQVFQPQQLLMYIINWFGPQINSYSIQQFNSLPAQQIKLSISYTLSRLNKITKQTQQLIQALKETYDGIFQNLEKINIWMSKCKDLLQDYQNNNTGNQGKGKEIGKDWWKCQINHYRLWVSCNNKDRILTYQVKLVCLTPSLTFNDLIRYKPRSIILTSGTLSPLNSWQKQLKLKFGVQLMNKHVVDNSQIHLGIVCKSIRNESTFNFSYNQLQNNHRIYSHLLATIVSLSKTIPNGILVIFPSYRIIKNFKDELQNDTVLLNQLKNNKNICFEDKNSIDFIIANFKSKAKTKKGAILFCVCRGKVSQGLDFADQMCRGVVFVGVPYPNIKDPLLKQKREYYDKLSTQAKNVGIKTLTGDQWYTLNTMRAVNQGIGRVIRHINDYGMILLLDNRYDQNKLKSMLPLWSKSSMKTYNNYQQIDHKMKLFYPEMKIKFVGKTDSQSDDKQFSQSIDNNNVSIKQRMQKITEKYSKKPMNAFDILMGKSRQNSKGKKNGKKVIEKFAQFQF